MKQGPLNLIVSAAPWNVFATLTFRQVPSEAAAMRYLHEWWDWSARSVRVKRERFLGFCRMERGELNLRLHLHSLIVVPEKYLRIFYAGPGKMTKAIVAWRHGISRFRRVSEFGDSAVPYLTVEQSSGADEYESNKSSRGQHVVFSNGFSRMLRAHKRGTAAADTKSILTVGN